MKNPNVRPSVGKKGTNGKFVVEVTSNETRVMARRFKTMEEAKDFYGRTLEVHVQKANREQRSYGVSCYTTKTAKDPKPDIMLDHAVVKPS